MQGSDEEVYAIMEYLKPSFSVSMPNSVTEERWNEIFKITDDKKLQEINKKYVRDVNIQWAKDRVFNEFNP